MAKYRAFASMGLIALVCIIVLVGFPVLADGAVRTYRWTVPWLARTEPLPRPRCKMRVKSTRWSNVCRMIYWTPLAVL